ncbi:MAG: HAD-IIA family hydrolase [Armatimonadota bacterium]|nr:HAD-IIA family hydrolase [Armatimonadota bacterium]
MPDAFDGVIFDVDGVLEYQGRAYPGAVELLGELRRRGTVIRILTNSTLKSRRSAGAKLRARGFPIENDQVITASFASAQYLRDRQARSCWVMVKGEGIEEFHDLVQDPERPEYLVLGDCRDDFSFQNMNRALKLLVNGAKLVVMIPEVTDSSMGDLELTVGAYGRMLEDAARATAVYIGKPSQYMFEIALDSMGINDRRRVLMVGDKIGTDIIGARRVGVRSALIKTGEYREGDLDGTVQPDYVFDSIDGLRRFLVAAKEGSR